MQDSWPSVEDESQRPSSLPRAEDLPIVPQGYDPERVREAFDAFYRHLARLDATLRTIEAVEVFRDQAAELRKELRALRTAGWTQQPWLPSYSSREPVRPGLPDAVLRWAIEACFVIAVPVIASVADLRSLWIFIAAAGAFAIVAIAEWASARERDVVPMQAAAPAVPAVEEPLPVPIAEPEPARVSEPAPGEATSEPAPGEATEWTLPPKVDEEEALTAVGPAEEEPAEAAEEAPEPEAEPVAEEPRRRSRWWRRRREDPEEGADGEDGRPRHVRVLPSDDESGIEPPLDPWEEELEPEQAREPDAEPTPRGWGS